MRQFEQKLKETYQQLPSSYLIEAEGNDTFSGFLRSIIGVHASANREYDPKNVYYLINGSKNLENFKNKIGAKYTPPSPPTTPPTRIKQPNIFNENGEIINEDQLAIRLYNAFDAATRNQRNYITLDEIYTGDVLFTSRGRHRIVGEQLNAPMAKIHKNIMNFLRKKQILSQDIVKYVTPDEITELDKGSWKKRLGGAIDKGIMTGARALGKEMTTGGVNYI